MKNLKLNNILIFVLALIFISCSPKNKDTQDIKVEPEVNTNIVKVISINPKEASLLTIDTKNGDNIEFRFSDNTLFGYGDDNVDINVSLSYEGGKLSGFTTDKDIVFVRPVYVAFELASLDENKRFLRYINLIDETKSQLLPYKIQGTKIVFELSHFSEYEFVEQAGINALSEANALLEELDIPDKSAGIREAKIKLDEVYVRLGLISSSNPIASRDLKIEADEMAVKYIDAFLDDNIYEGDYLIANEISPAFREYMEELIYNTTALERYGASDIPLEKENFYLEKLADAFSSKTIDNICADTQMQDFTKLGYKILTELASYGQSADDDYMISVNEKIETTIVDNSIDISKIVCGKSCLNTALSIGDGTFAQASIAKLETALNNTKECEIKLRVDDKGSDFAKLIWVTVEKAPKQYTIYSSLSSFNNPKASDNYASLEGKTVASTSTTDITLNDLSEDTIYYFMLSYFDSKGDILGLSNEISVKTETLDDSKNIYFTKIGRNGDILKKQNVSWDNNGSEEDGSRWSCLRDEETGYLWEFKNTDGSDPIHTTKIQFVDDTETFGREINITLSDNYHHFYNNFSYDDDENAEVLSSEEYLHSEGALYYGFYARYINKTSWHKLKDYTNNESLCGRDDWKLPNEEEALTYTFGYDVYRDYAFAYLSESERQIYINKFTKKNIHLSKLRRGLTYRPQHRYTRYQLHMMTSSLIPVSICYDPYTGYVNESFYLTYVADKTIPGWCNFEGGYLLHEIVPIAWLGDYQLFGSMISFEVAPAILVSKKGGKEPNTVEAGEDIEITYGEESLAQIATNTPDGSVSQYFSSNPNIASVDINTGIITIWRAGKTKITVKNSGNAEYAKGQDDFLVTVSLADLDISIGDDKIFTLGSSGSYSQPLVGYKGAGKITYKSSNPDVAIVDNDGNVLVLNVGESVISVEIDDNVQYKSVNDSYTLTVTSPNILQIQIIDAGEDVIRDINLSDNNFTQVASTFAGVGEIRYSSSDTSIAKVNNKGEVQILAAGECNITASIGADNNYFGAHDSYLLQVNKLDPKLIVGPDVTMVFKANLYYTGGVAKALSSGKIVYSSDGYAAPVDDKGKVTIATAGYITTITASIEETDIYKSDSKSYTITVTGLGAGY